MIVRLVAVDPRPDAGAPSDVVTYQVPENSRAMKLLCELFDAAGIEWAVIGTERRKAVDKKVGQ